MAPPKKDTRSNTAGKQASVEPSSSEEERVRENPGELVRTASGTELIAHTNPPELRSNPSSSRSIIPGISQPQMADIYTYVNGQIITEMERLEQRLHEKMELQTQKLAGIFAKQLNVQNPLSADDADDASPDNPPLKASTSAPQESAPKLRAEEVGYFDPEYTTEGASHTAVVNAGKHVYYRDVYVFVDRLKDLAVQNKDVKNVIVSCLRGSALMWYSMELSEDDRDRIREEAGLTT